MSTIPIVKRTIIQEEPEIIRGSMSPLPRAHLVMDSKVTTLERSCSDNCSRVTAGTSITCRHGQFMQSNTYHRHGGYDRPICSSGRSNDGACNVCADVLNVHLRAAGVREEVG